MGLQNWMNVLVLTGIVAPQACLAFSNSGGGIPGHSICDLRRNSRVGNTALHDGLFDGAKDALKNVFGGGGDDGPKTVFEIPVDNIKPGPLRFFLQIHIVGMKNSQGETQTWLPRESEDGGLEIYFKDATGMCKISMEPNAIKAERHGQKPSLQYLLQESVMLHGVLDELNTVAFEAEVEDEEQRLLLVEEGSLDKARETLPARQQD